VALSLEEMTMDSNDRGGSGVGFGIGLVAGALFGAAVGLLLAPKSGAELRGDLNARAREAGDRLKEQVRQAEDAAAAWAERGREVAERGRVAVDRGREAVARGVEEARRFSKSAAEEGQHATKV
jgi:gas vesicle protein